MITRDSMTGGGVDMAGFVSPLTEAGTNIMPGATKGNAPGRKARSTNATLGADEEAPQLTASRPDSRYTSAPKGLDKALLRRAVAILESFDSHDVVATELNMDALRGLVLELWESAQSATQLHQDILALMEGAVLSVTSLNEAQVLALKEGFRDLANPILVQVHVDLIRDRLIAQGFSPLALLGELANDGGS
ncbi:MAG: hypothetical protein A2Y77_12545 [Planctomycetes bacterium RBG_13_62_9]|nr:MAG: hypothetical protein A2Y77_12545 [Planctomycetes bacterium RBG_13_62_9]